jgi:hypothetical protein
MESAVCHDNTQLLIEDQEGIADRIHDRLGERARIIEIYKQVAVGPRQRVCRWGALSRVRSFHVYSTLRIPARSASKKLPNLTPASVGYQRLPELPPQLLLPPRLKGEGESPFSLSEQPLRKAKTVQNCSALRIYPDALGAANGTFKS